MFILDLKLCTGCRRCEVACSFYHFKLFSRKYSRIKVVKIEEIGIDAPVFCIQCKEKYCLNNCPQKALYTGDYGEITVDVKKCNGCNLCSLYCPIGAIEIIDGYPILCDLCQGNPECIKVCNTGALKIDENKKKAVSLHLNKFIMKKSPEEKRYNYIKKISKELRNKWKNRIMKENLCSDIQVND
ncbi:hypothetical protein DRQ09_06570 [candidate division KSB1 bacterium]|nr:MAG: hypothetical protein DRQ09_06570 [candidate division KSB1 bacterium]